MKKTTITFCAIYLLMVNCYSQEAINGFHMYGGSFSSIGFGIGAAGEGSYSIQQGGEILIQYKPIIIGGALAFCTFPAPYHNGMLLTTSLMIDLNKKPNSIIALSGRLGYIAGTQSIDLKAGLLLGGRAFNVLYGYVEPAIILNYACVGIGINAGFGLSLK